MKKIFEQLILDFHGSDIPVPSRRDFSLPKFPENIRKAFVFIGMRRSGKTWAMYQQMNNLIERGIKKQEILYINFEDERLSSLKTEGFQSILDAYFNLYPDYIKSNNLHFFFDEIHEINGWEKFIRRLLDQEKMQIYISGSSAKMLSKEIASNLRGRTITQEIFPFSFKEYLHFKKVELKRKLTSKEKAVVSHHLKDFLQYGGFPETVSIEKQFHRDLLQGYIDVVIYRDIIERHKITNLHAVRDLIKFCVQNASSSASMFKIYNRFKSQGKKVGKNSLYEFMDYLEDAYCVFSVPVFKHSFNERTITPKKIYVVDQGLITAYTIKPEFEEAARLENAVFCKLRREAKEIFYYKTKSGKEVDFIALMPTGEKIMLQVSTSISDPKTRERELSALREAIEETKISSATIITTDDKNMYKVDGATIKTIPAYEWLGKNELKKKVF